MNENIKQYTRIGGKSFMGWIKVAVLGSVITLICFITAIVLYADNTGPGFSGAGHAGGIGAIMGLIFLFVEEFWTALLLFGSLGCIVFYFSFAGKYAVHKAIEGIWAEKLSDSLVTNASNFINKLSEKQPGWMKNAGNAAKVKLQLAQTMKNDSSITGIQRKVLGYGLKKVSLQDIDFSDEQVNLGIIIVGKLKNRLDEVAQPTMRLFWIVAGLEFAVLILAIIFNHS